MVTPPYINKDLDLELDLICPRPSSRSRPSTTRSSTSSTYPEFKYVSCLVLTNRSTKASSSLPLIPDTCSRCWFSVWSSNRRLSPPIVSPDSIFLSVVSAVKACRPSLI